MTKFYKYQGTGNDFVMIDNRALTFNDSIENISNFCHRRFGVGADGLILIQNDPKYDFRMVYFNADGNEGSMCGNGGRCAVKFASDLGIFKNKTHFIAVDGPHDAEIIEGNVSLGMKDVNNIETLENGYFLDTGSPHLIVFVENIENVNVKELGSSIRYSQYWIDRGGVNVNFVEITKEDGLKVRTYERGVEDETYSCGTGVTAAALTYNHIYKKHGKVNIETLGGNLFILFETNIPMQYANIQLIGAAVKVFEGNL